MNRFLVFQLFLLFAAGAAAQDAAPALQSRPASKTYQLNAGHKIPLTIIHGTSTRMASVGDQIYLQTAFPVWHEGKLLVPVGAYVLGTVTDVKRAGRVKGRAEIHLRFDHLTLPNGVTRDFRGTISSADGESVGAVNREEGSIKGQGNIGSDVNTVAGATITGAVLGTAIGAAAGSGGVTNTGNPSQDAANAARAARSTINGMRTGVIAGTAAGAGVGMIAVLLTRGPDVVLAPGQSVEMELDRPISFEESEIDFPSAR